MDLALPLGAESDEELLQTHQHKVTVRVYEIRHSLAEIGRQIDASQEDERALRTQIECIPPRNYEWREHQRDVLGLDFYDPPYPMGPTRPPNLEELQMEHLRVDKLYRALGADKAALLREHDVITHPVTLEAFTSSAMRRMPADVVLAIFMAVKSSADVHKAPTAHPWDHQPRIMGRDINTFPRIHRVGHGAGHLLSSVCNVWRNLACDYPLLWSSFSFSLFGNTSVELVAVYLERSRSAPLTVEIDARERVVAGPPSERAIGLLAAHSHHLTPGSAPTSLGQFPAADGPPPARQHLDGARSQFRWNADTHLDTPLRECNINFSALLPILELIPNLESFTIIVGPGTTIADRMFHYLAIRDDLPRTLTTLSSLTLIGGFSFATGALVDMLTTRTAPEASKSMGTCVCLTDVLLSLPDRVVDAGAVNRLRNLEGITVRLECRKVLHGPFHIVL
ncbi:hypothetical protein B0H13DRAFT_2442601 [Mycena leptocephala]|nr:hypothetical protein B0H13DRAFT_2442601 [Mycena leptocephala]